MSRLQLSATSSPRGFLDSSNTTPRRLQDLKRELQALDNQLSFQGDVAPMSDTISTGVDGKTLTPRTGLVLNSPLRSKFATKSTLGIILSGTTIKTIVPWSPAHLSQKVNTNDELLEVNESPVSGSNAKSALEVADGSGQVVRIKIRSQRTAQVVIAELAAVDITTLERIHQVFNTLTLAKKNGFVNAKFEQENYSDGQQKTVDVVEEAFRHMSTVLIAHEHGRLTAKKKIEELETQPGQQSQSKPFNSDKGSDRAAIGAKERQIEQLLREKAEITAQKTMLEAENRALNKQSNPEISDMAQELARMQEERREAVSQLHEKDAMLEQLKARVAKTRRESFVTKEAHSDLEQRLIEAQRQLADSEKQEQTLKQELAEERARREELEQVSAKGKEEDASKRQTSDADAQRHQREKEKEREREAAIQVQLASLHRIQQRPNPPAGFETYLPVHLRRHVRY